jgi:hypothetical protein
MEQGLGEFGAPLTTGFILGVPKIKAFFLLTHGGSFYMCLSYNSEFWYYHLFCCFINGSLLFCGPPFRAFKGTVGCGWETGTQGVLHYHVCREAARIFFGWPKKVEFWYLGANHAAHVTFPSLPFYKWCVFIAIVLYVGRCLIFFPLLKIKLQLLRQYGIRLTIQLVSSSILWMRSAAFSLGRVTSLVAETDVGSAAETGGGEAPARCRTVRHGRACESAEMAAARAKKTCTSRESNPGLYRGRVLFYH